MDLKDLSTRKCEHRAVYRETFHFLVLRSFKSMHHDHESCNWLTGWLVGWLVGFEFNGPLRQYFSLYRAVSQRGRKRRERTDESKNIQTTPTRTYCQCSRPLPYWNPNCRTPKHWKFTQHHRTTRPLPWMQVSVSFCHLDCNKYANM